MKKRVSLVAWNYSMVELPRCGPSFGAEHSVPPYSHAWDLWNSTWLICSSFLSWRSVIVKSASDIALHFHYEYSDITDRYLLGTLCLLTRPLENSMSLVAQNTVSTFHTKFNLALIICAQRPSNPLWYAVLMLKTKLSIIFTLDKSLLWLNDENFLRIAFLIIKWTVDQQQSCEKNRRDIVSATPGKLMVDHSWWPTDKRQWNMRAHEAQCKSCICVRHLFMDCLIGQTPGVASTAITNSRSIIAHPCWLNRYVSRLVFF